MKILSPRVLVLSIVIGVGVGAVIGILFAVIGDREIFYGIGTGLFVCGIGCAGAGLLGATEPSEGWASARRNEPWDGRRGVIARIVEDSDQDAPPMKSWPMAVWGIVVGGCLIGLAMSAFTLGG